MGLVRSLSTSGWATCLGFYPASEAESTVR